MEETWELRDDEEGWRVSAAVEQAQDFLNDPPADYPGLFGGP